MTNRNEPHIQQTFFDMEESTTRDSGPVTCLGMTFPNDEERRKHFLGLLREKLNDPEFRKIEGFPIGSDEDILALSDPPYYTACPNPFIEDFIRHYGKPYDPSEPYSREPFAADVSEGKNDKIYKAHSYHTKVPHLAIVPSILHYTEPGDVVLDGFCGSGMTGVAAQWCGTAPEDYRRKVESEFEKQGIEKPKWGVRRVVLNDLSPAATFIASNYNLPFDVREFSRVGKLILDEVEQEIGWMYRTAHVSTEGTKGHEGEISKILLGETSCPSWMKIGCIEYTVWSEIFTCPDCAGEVVFLDEAIDEDTKRVKDFFPCPHCGSNLTKDNLQRVFETRSDPANSRSWKRVKYQPSLISYTAGGKHYEKQPDMYDLDILKRIEAIPLPVEMPTNRFPIEQMYHGSRIGPKGFSKIHHFFLPRAAHALAALWRKANAHPDPRIRHMLLFFVEQAITSLNIQNRYGPHRYSQSNGSMLLVYYVPSLISEVSPWYVLGGKLERLCKTWVSAYTTAGASLLQTGTAAGLGISTNSIDYIFTDPPFGENIYYADLNFLVESWHRVITNAVPEAIVDRFKKKDLPEYQHLMQRCFEEYYRVLKPGRWMTVVFHNSRNAVWNAIQEGMQAAGFVVADVRTLDKQQGSYRQVTSTAVKQDLVISAYKPNGGLEERFRLEAGTENGVWDFVRTHLKQLPVFVSKDDQAEVIAERQGYLLFDRMVAFHVQRGVTIPLSAAEFYAGIVQRFSERDGMYFLPEQVAEYDKKRMTVREVLQLRVFVVDESSAIEWLKQQLLKKPQTFQDIHPQFMKELGGWQKHEKPLELSELLEQSFLRYDLPAASAAQAGEMVIPAQIVSWMKQSSQLRELISAEVRGTRCETENSGALRIAHPALLREAKDRWYVPDPNKAGDLEKLRERSLLKEFEDYRTSGQRRLKLFRLEAVRAGFKKAWQERDYATIISVAQKIPENVLQEDPKLLMWYDQAVTRMGEGCFMAGGDQASFFRNELSAEAETTPAVIWEQGSAKRALDELFTLTCQYKTSKAYHELMQFVARFRFYSPFNAMLVHVQMTGAKYVAPPHRWLRDFGRRIKAGARPLVILQPMGPVMFVFDVSDTEPIDNNTPLPPEVDRPFEVRKGFIGDRLERLIENTKHDGIRVTKSHEGSQSAGSIRYVAKDVRGSQKFQVGIDEHRKPILDNIPISYELLVNEKLSREAQYVTIVHELAHLYCGHLGTPNDKWWPDRRGLNNITIEFEAESVAYLVCSRCNIDNPSEQYLSGYVGKEVDVPPISLECVMKAVGLIETMSQQRMKPRKKSKDELGG